MALVRAERVLETSTTTGTGSLSLGGPVTGYRSFASVMATNDTCYYAIVAVDSSGRPTGDWETGLGTLTASTTFTRTTPLASSNGGALVTLTAGTKQVFLTLTATEIGALKTDVDSKAATATTEVITATQTGGSGWLLPTGAKSVHVICIGGGGGGGGGGRNTVTSTSGGGAGGAGGGGRVEAILPASQIGTPGTTRVDITIGAGGSGGSGQTSSVQAGNGTDGGTTSFGTLLYALGGKLSTRGALDVAGNDGLGAYVVDGTQVDERISPYNGGTGDQGAGSSFFQVALSATGGAGGGGAGGGAGAATVGNQGSPLFLNSSGLIGSDGTAGSSTTTAGATAGAGGDGTSRSGSGRCGGGGGGGGAQNATTGTTGIGGQGGAGGLPGGAGGGGGGARSSSTRGGNGGAGGRGEVIITVYY